MVTFDGDQGTAGNQPLGIGNYVLTLKDAVYDQFNNKLDGDYNGTPGGNFTRSFSVYGNGPVAGQPTNLSLPSGLTLPGTPNPDDTTIADILVNTTDAWDMPGYRSGNRSQNGRQRQRRLRRGLGFQSDAIPRAISWPNATIASAARSGGKSKSVPIKAKPINAGHSGGPQIQPDVAMDAYGNFVVTWSGQGASDIVGRVRPGLRHLRQRHRRRFPRQPVRHRTSRIARPWPWTPTAMSSSPGPAPAKTATRTASLPDASISSARRKATNSWSTRTTKYSQQASDVAMDANGNFTVVWQSDQQDGNSWGIYGQRFNAAGQRVGGEFRVNTYTTDKQTDPQIAMDAAGDFMVAWQSFGQDGSGYGVYARRYNAAGTALKAANSASTKPPTIGNTSRPSAPTRTAISWWLWAAFEQTIRSVNDYGIFAHMYNADGSTYIDPNSGLAMDEFRVNIATVGNQTTPAVAMDAERRLRRGLGRTRSRGTIPAGIPTTAIYSRVVVLNPSTYSTYTPKSPTDEFSYTPTQQYLH